MYLLFLKLFETFWSRDVIIMWDISTFWVQISKDFWTISSLYVLNCFKFFLRYYFGTNYLKILKKNFFEPYQVFMCNFLFQNDKVLIKILEVHQFFMRQMFQYYWCTLKALLCKNWFYFFFLISHHSKIPPCFRITPSLKVFCLFKFTTLSQKSGNVFF